MIEMFGILAGPLGIVMRFLYSFLGNYGWTIIIFTFIIRIVLIPLSLYQQKSMSRMSAYQPMIQEIQKKWQNDRNRQSEELQKFYTENNIKMTGGCAPMFANMLVIFGIIAVIQAPLQYMVDLPSDQIDNARVIISETREDVENDSRQNYTIQSLIIGDIKDNPEKFIEGVPGEDGQMVSMSAESVQKVQDFNFEFMGMNLAERPAKVFNRYLILPILSILTMFASQFIILKTGGTQSGQQARTMLVMTVVMGVMFGFFAFTVPVGFSLYYTISNVAMTVQQVLLKKVYDPKKMQAKIMEEIEERKKQKKSKKVVAVKDKSGQVIEKEMTDAEIARLRLEKARKMDAEKYASENEKPEEDEKKEVENKEDAPAIEETKEESVENAEAPQEPEAADVETEAGEEKQEEYKPGRRKRAKMKKTDQNDDSTNAENIDNEEVTSEED